MNIGANEEENSFGLRNESNGMPRMDMPTDPFVEVMQSLQQLASSVSTLMDEVKASNNELFYYIRCVLLHLEKYSHTDYFKHN